MDPPSWHLAGIRATLRKRFSPGATGEGSERFRKWSIRRLFCIHIANADETCDIRGEVFTLANTLRSIGCEIIKFQIEGIVIKYLSKIRHHYITEKFTRKLCVYMTFGPFNKSQEIVSVSH